MKNVLLIGQFTDISGYGNAVRSYFKNLKNLHEQQKINLNILNYSFERNSSISKDEKEEIINFSITTNLEVLQGRYSQEKKEITEYLNKEYTLILFLTNDFLDLGKGSPNLFLENGLLNINKIVKNSVETIPCVVWETDKPPEMWIRGYKEEKVTKLICACGWNSKVFKQHTKKETKTIPYSLQSNGAHDPAFSEKLQKIISNKFTFCSVGQWGDRKGFDLLLRAFYTEFYNDEVFLILKTYKNKAFINSNEKNILNNEIEKIKTSINNYGKEFKPKCKLVLLTDLMTKEKINSIYKVSDCYVTATRGEGFGLPIAEFINVAKKPVVSPSKGGHIDFIHKENYFVDSSYEPVKGLNSLYSEIEMNYVEPSLRDLRNKMRKAYEEKNNNSIGQKSYDFLQEYLSDINIESKFSEVLEIE